VREFEQRRAVIAYSIVIPVRYCYNLLLMAEMMRGGDHEWRKRRPPTPDRRTHQVEGGPELGRLRDVIAQILAIPVGDPGEPPTTDERLRQLEMILGAEPQRDQAGSLRYLLTSGLAVELMTGYVRPHHDIDLVIMDPANKGKFWELYGTDNVTPGQYWAAMRFEPEFLGNTARKVRTRGGEGSPVVEVVHPGIILAQKSSNAWGRPPRARDKSDVAAIVKHWKGKEGYTKEWNPIVRKSIDALPVGQQHRTLARVRRAIR
jgi:hypothetical protein